MRIRKNISSSSLRSKRSGKRLWVFLFFVILAAGLLLSACAPSGPCTMTANGALTAYRLPDASSDVFGTVQSGDSFEVEARTADDYLGFEPGVAQAGNIGLARLRWVQDPLTVSPSCLSDVNLVTIEDVQADIDASGGG